MCNFYKDHLSEKSTEEFILRFSESVHPIVYQKKMAHWLGLGIFYKSKMAASIFNNKILSSNPSIFVNMIKNKNTSWRYLEMTCQILERFDQYSPSYRPLKYVPFCYFHKFSQITPIIFFLVRVSSKSKEEKIFSMMCTTYMWNFSQIYSVCTEYVPIYYMHVFNK